MDENNIMILIRYGQYHGRVFEILENIQDKLQNLHEFDFPQDCLNNLKDIQQELDRAITYMDMS